ncbi:MAG: SOS response-associated peptidase [Geminicoccaceae bacterium]|nr:SOS response-associated peptidase [Geminicoccaceae bacterium]
MCGRFLLTSPLEAVHELFHVPERPNLGARYNIAPTQDVPVVRRTRDGGGRELAMVRWGLVPFFAKDPSVGNRMINARLEGLASKPAFREPVRRRRCLIPADGFFEWRKDGRKKQPYLIRRKDGGLFAFAGLWDVWRGPDGRSLHSCTIITGPANELVAPLHGRMPVILGSDDHERWLNGDLEAALGLLEPCPSDWLESFPVSPRVGSPANDDPELIRPLTRATPDLFG